MKEPDGGCEKRYPCIGPIAGTQPWDTQSGFHKKIQKDSSHDMDQDINQMVTRNIVFVEIVVQSEADVRHRTIRCGAFKPSGDDVLHTEAVYADILVF